MSEKIEAAIVQVGSHDYSNQSKGICSLLVDTNTRKPIIS